jgi:type I restriction enzyme M protein
VADAVELVEVRIVPSRAGAEEEWDWIRIDDLPNRPWQVESLRTVQGLEIEGALYPVAENDILLARLGPAILNAKFVLAPKPARQTLASPEFLVLRCKQGWQPEVVLWILRMKLFRDIMYLRSRGGTPSRYRLDGEDLLSIPFPPRLALSQNDIVIEVRRRRDLARTLRAEAETGWAEAKRWFEEQLLGPEPE